MTRLTLTNYVQGNATLLQNEFIDEYMPSANGEYVKVYLTLLRLSCDPAREVTIRAIAAHLECPETDIRRALDYWKKRGLLDYEPAASPDVISAPLTDKDEADSASAAADKALAGSTSAAADRTAAKNSRNRGSRRSRQNRSEFREIVSVTETYLGKTLNKTESDALVYFYDELGMSADLIEYLIESCVDNGHRSIHYINTVALSWADRQITTIEEAKAASGQYSRNSYAVLNAFGIKGRAPAPSEITFIRRWNEEYGFTNDLILEACDRTMRSIHQPSFEYTDSILRNWKEKNVHTLTDVKELDTARKKEKKVKNKEAEQTGTARSSRKSFNNFEGRTYQNMDELTRRLIEAQ